MLMLMLMLMIDGCCSFMKIAHPRVRMLSLYVLFLSRSNKVMIY